MEIQSNNSLWSKQVEAEYTFHSSTSNIKENNTSNNSETGNRSKHRKQYKINKALVLNNMLLSHETSIAIDQHVLNTQQEVYEVSLAYNINCPNKPNA